MPTTVAVTMAMTSTLMTTGCDIFQDIQDTSCTDFRMFIRNDSKLNKSDDLCERCK